VREYRASQSAPYAFERIIGDSPAMQKVKTLLRKIAAGPASTVLLTGESGTGKDLAAKAIHYNGVRAAQPFLNVTCSALPETLLESELFGHERGAFTDARAQKRGLFETADGGSIFLDEIGEMVPALQAKLLRALEAGEVRRVGSNESRKVDVRFVAATNVDLQDAVQAGRFRQDLYYRLNVHHVHLPPLRDRGDDVRLLVEHFLARYGPSAGVTACSDAARAVLVAYAYPGNVRELEHVIQRAVAVAQGPTIEPDDLQEHLVAGRAAAPPSEGSVAAARERAEREMIVAALARQGGEVTAAARDLQVSRTTLWRMMKKHGLS
jgi:transcriptional regulator with PAS, ATPase and Fis domain